MDILTPRKSARHQLARAMREREREESQARVQVVKHFDDGALLLLHRPKPRSVYSGLHHAGPVRRGDDVRPIRCGPNEVHACIFRGDGSVEDLGVSKNLMTNIGNMVIQGWMGGAIPAGGQGTPATATSATSLTGTGTPWTASNLATPQLGLAGMRVVAPVTGITTAPVYGNIVSNTSSILTLDQWWTGIDGVGTTPASTNSFIIMPGGVASVRFMALSTDAAAAAATHTTLASEVTTNGGGRALGTFARGSNPSGGSGTFTLTKAYSITGTITAVHKAGLFCCLTSAGADPVIFETVLNADASLSSGDTLTLTWTGTLSG